MEKYYKCYDDVYGKLSTLLKGNFILFSIVYSVVLIVVINLYEINENNVFFFVLLWISSTIIILFITVVMINNNIKARSGTNEEIEVPNIKIGRIGESVENIIVSRMKFIIKNNKHNEFYELDNIEEINSLIRMDLFRRAPSSNLSLFSFLLASMISLFSTKLNVDLIGKVKIISLMIVPTVALCGFLFIKELSRGNKEKATRRVITELFNENEKSKKSNQNSGSEMVAEKEVNRQINLRNYRGMSKRQKAKQKKKDEKKMKNKQ